MIEARIKLTQPCGNGRQFIATSGSGHHLLMDDSSGNTAAKPIELVAVALAGCTAFDVINILRKKRQHVADYEVRVEADQAPDPPQVFTEIRIEHRLTGINLAAKAVEDAIRLSEEKYCSVGAMLGKTAQIRSTFSIEPAEVEEFAGFPSR